MEARHIPNIYAKLVENKVSRAALEGLLPPDGEHEWGQVLELRHECKNEDGTTTTKFDYWALHKRGADFELRFNEEVVARDRFSGLGPVFGHRRVDLG